ncbi:hypothetical protein J1N35_034960, partial [Gossypium stocksii]
RLLCTPKHYNLIFHGKIAPYVLVIGSELCMYCERRFLRLLSAKHIQELNKKTCDIGGPIEFVNQTRSIDLPFFRYDSLTYSYQNDIDGNVIICAAIHILPTEFAKDVQLIFPLHGVSIERHSTADSTKFPTHLKRAYIAHGGALTSLYVVQ